MAWHAPRVDRTEGARLTEVARTAGVGQGSRYRRFPGSVGLVP
ncbi:hypothetical protein [Nonomuraea sp. NPDC049709]